MLSDYNQITAELKRETGDLGAGMGDLLTQIPQDSFFVVVTTTENGRLSEPSLPRAASFLAHEDVRPPFDNKNY